MDCIAAGWVLRLARRRRRGAALRTRRRGVFADAAARAAARRVRGCWNELRSLRRLFDDAPFSAAQRARGGDGVGFQALQRALTLRVAGPLRDGCGSMCATR
mmetsp:Transcript_34460/g.106508  ORF Transcript_34460/g.106508 Transcript_34460/m.106508 type:complete len:102 (-) Transcript_34460:41-346(-)